MSKNPTIGYAGSQGAAPAAALHGQSRAVRRRLKLARQVVSTAVWAGPKIWHISPLRRALANMWERKVREQAQADIEAGLRPPGVILDRAEIGVAILRSIERALAEGRLSKATVDRILTVLVGDTFVDHGLPDVKDRFKSQFGVRPPGFLLVSPTKTCNLRCLGCYADSGSTKERLEWPILNRLVRETHDLWGALFIVISGGEPLAYRDDGKTVLDLAEQNPDCFFMMYTNGTLIDDAVARRLGKIGNLTPAISVEGLREQTDKRRGAGIFAQVLAAIERLRREKVIFGVSMTATRENADIVLSDEVINFYFDEMGATYGWLFHYMPIGRAPTLESLPTPEQRLRMWQRSRQLVKERHLFIADFWNSGPAALGCVSAGHEGGYLTVDWDGKISPCVFVPYTPVNIHDIYARGQTVTDAWKHPFFAKLRAWQWEYSNEKKFTKGSWHGNWMMPCPIRDHYEDFYKMLSEFQPEPVDESARAAAQDPAFRQGMMQYNRAVAALFDPIWQKKYMDGKD